MAIRELRVPDIGDFKDVPVIEVLVKPGDLIAPEQSLITLESDKATMEVPAEVGGRIVELRVKLGDKVSEGTVIAVVEVAEGAASAVAAPVAAPQASSAAGDGPHPLPGAEGAIRNAFPEGEAARRNPLPGGEGGPQGGVRGDAALPEGEGDPPGRAREEAVALIDEAGFRRAHASPSVRKFARELGVDLSRVKGSGPKGRILREDVQAYVKGVMAGTLAPAPAPSASEPGPALGLIPWPKVDFAKFGEIEVKPLSRIKKISGANLHRNWVMIPHVTNHDECDVTELEAFRVQLNKELEKSGVKVSLLAFMIKAAVATLKRFPNFNASLDGENLVLKRYYHIGFAADTPNGLVVPVIKNADQKGVIEIARELAELAKLAREGKLKPEQMQGGTFSISSLGGIGGTYFTPIINAPEVAILGVCRTETKPRWNGREFEPRLMLPLSLSWDHRVIDGAEAARFLVELGRFMSDFRRVLL
ncbi:MAG: dihydrolipoyllysine-residue acetyltransferase [Casimicrobiaceae bacterium]|nr:dihydrolipoyllysine-residue acetyltransferase [Casimicrobiaceae bacterium]MCX8099514.1 dihydrolipoyllysine-residue acetyltransferase [Casimicrobiaceae bacterium]MDW8312249.1 dihydrolipoyllysine-residue acetyltransferase [Burkholderiales bacterium]